MTLDWLWLATGAAAIDALSQTEPGELRYGRVRRQVSLAALFVTPD